MKEYDVVDVEEIEDSRQTFYRKNFMQCTKCKGIRRKHKEARFIGYNNEKPEVDVKSGSPCLRMLDGDMCLGVYGRVKRVPLPKK